MREGSTADGQHLFPPAAQGSLVLPIYFRLTLIGFPHAPASRIPHPPSRSSTVDSHLAALYTTSPMAKTDLASGPRVGRESGSRRSWLYWTVATVVLLAGFADLARGGETLAPILPGIGYCWLVPLAILR